jgi:predicted nucleic acid-binding protein
LTFLLDTNVVSEPRRRRAEGAVVGWLRDQDSEALFISVLTIGEITAGVEMLARRDPVAGGTLRNWFAGIRSGYRERVLPVTEPIVEVWGRLQARRTLPVIDGLLAATALVHALTLVTRNHRDFANLGVPLLNPWP